MPTNTLQFQQWTETSIQSLETQIGQLATTVNELESQGSGILPSQLVVNRRANVSAIFLRSGKQVAGLAHQFESESSSGQSREPSSSSDNTKQKNKDDEVFKSRPLPFPQRLTQSKVDEVELDREIMETFKKVEVNIPLLEAIRQILKYAKFLKEL